MNFLERDLEDILYEGLRSDAGAHELYSRGFDLYEPCENKVYRQLKIGNYGICDLLTARRIIDKYPYLRLIIFELKKDEINIDAVKQICRYEVGIRSYLDRRTIPFDITLCLIGRSMKMSDEEILIAQKINELYIYTYSYDIDGIKFKAEDSECKLTNEGF